MANKIILKKSSISERVPTVDDLAYGELAINYTDGKLYYKRSDNTIQVLNDLDAAQQVDELYLLDNISSSFNGVTTSFPITIASESQSPEIERLIISVGGVLQKPDPVGNTGFRVSGSNIVFASAPKAGQDFFGYYIKNVLASETSGASKEFSVAMAVAFGF